MNPQEEEIAKEEQNPVVAGPLYRFRKDVSSIIHRYLDTRPFAEVDELITNLFEDVDPNAYITPQGLNLLIEYLRSCPRNDVKKIFTLLREENALQKFEYQPEAPTAAENASVSPN